MFSLFVGLLGVSTLVAEPDTTILLPKGHKAFALKFDPNRGAFVQPGQRADVLHRVRDGDKVKSKIVVSNVLVLAVDANGRGNTSATLAVTADDAKILLEAEKNGELRILIRAPAGK